MDPTTKVGSAKLEAVLETMETLRAEGHKALVFSQFTQMLGLLKAELDARQVPYLYLDGRKTRLQPEQLFANEVEEKTFDGEDHGDDQDALRLRWLDSIRTRQPSVSPVELATKVMVIVELATRSMWEGAAFGFNPANRKVRKF